MAVLFRQERLEGMDITVVNNLMYEDGQNQCICADLNLQDGSYLGVQSLVYYSASDPVSQ